MNNNITFFFQTAWILMVLAFGLASSKSRPHPQLNDFHNRNKGKYIISNIALVLTTLGYKS